MHARVCGIQLRLYARVGHLMHRDTLPLEFEIDLEGLHRLAAHLCGDVRGDQNHLELIRF